MAEKPKKEHVTININSALMERLREHCLKDKRTFSSAFEIAIEKYLENSAKENR